MTEGATLKFSGDTYNFRDLIKALPGARWVAAEKVWAAPSAGADLTAIKERMASYEHDRAFWTAAIAANATVNIHLSRPRGNKGPCCSKAKAFTQYDAQGPICYRCEKHGETYNSYCGD